MRTASRALLTVLTAILSVNASSAFAFEGQKGYAKYFGGEDGHGVEAGATISYESDAGTDAEKGYSAAGSNEANANGTPSSSNSGSVSGQPKQDAGPQVVTVPVVFSTHNCAPVYGTATQNLSYSVAQPGSTDCPGFVFIAPDKAPKAPKAPKPAAGTPARPPTPQEIAGRLADKVVKQAGRPQLAVAPGRVGLTGLKSYFWLQSPLHPITATATVAGFSVTAQAVPYRYDWSFGDGDGLATRDPGRPWSRSHPGTIGHLYETSGHYEVSVAVRWVARWRIGGGPWRPLGYFTTSDDQGYPVRQVVARLTASEH